MNNLDRAIEHVEAKTEYTIQRCEGDGQYLKCWVGDQLMVQVRGSNDTMILHELGHVALDHGFPPVNLLESLTRELDAWRVAECLAYKFDIPFCDETYAEGIDTYIYDLVDTLWDPGHAFLCQLFGNTLITEGTK
jgi:hypothetical protein